MQEEKVGTSKKKPVRKRKTGGRVKRKPKDIVVSAGEEAGVVLQKEFEIYALWKSLPPMALGMDEGRLSQLGIDDPVITKLMSIRTQDEFAKKFKVGVNTLTRWNNKLNKVSMMDNIRTWATQLSSNVIFALYRKALQHGDKGRVGLWLEAIERLQVDKPSPIQIQINNRILAIGEQYERELKETIREGLRSDE